MLLPPIVNIALYNSKIEELTKSKEKVTEFDEKNKNLIEKLATQKEEIEKIQENFVDKFNKLANDIFENKSKKFTDLNKEQLKGILEPLGKNIEDFKKQVEEMRYHVGIAHFPQWDAARRGKLKNVTLIEEINNGTET